MAKLSANRLLDILQRTAIWKLWGITVVCAMVMTEITVSIMAWYLLGHVSADYLITGMVASFLAASVMLGIVLYFTGQLRALNESLAGRIQEESEKNRQKDLLLFHQARLATMGEMLQNIAHQWRQPLNVVGLVIQNLRLDFKEGILGEAELEAYVASAMKAISRMSTTIDDFRNFFEPNRVKERFSPLKVIADCQDLLAPSLKVHGIELSIASRGEGEIYGYPGELAQVVLNLITNAKDAILERRAQDGRIRIDLGLAGEHVVLTVEDNGGGIPAEHVHRVFDPYFTTKESGTGIGLYMARMIVEQHMQGTLRLENLAGGARFLLTLPR